VGGITYFLLSFPYQFLFLGAIKSLTNYSQVGKLVDRPTNRSHKIHLFGPCVLLASTPTFDLSLFSFKRQTTKINNASQEEEEPTINDRGSPNKNIHCKRATATTSRCPIARFNDNETKSKAFLPGNNTKKFYKLTIKKHRELYRHKKQDRSNEEMQHDSIMLLT